MTVSLDETDKVDNSGHHKHHKLVSPHLERNFCPTYILLINIEHSNIAYISSHCYGVEEQCKYLAVAIEIGLFDGDLVGCHHSGTTN